MKIYFLIFVIHCITFNELQSQNTIGLIEIDQNRISPGYNLIYPNNQSSVFLLNECGQIVNEWNDQENTAPGAVAKLTPAGNLLKAKASGEFMTPSFGAGGSGGIIEIFDWENNLLSRRVIRDSIYRQHHDLALMPNGNVMCIVYERKSFEEIVQAGFDTLTNNQTELWFDCIYELSSNLDSILWEWHSFDHLIQDFDSNKDNFGVVSEHPEKIDINYQDFSFGRQDFMHSNAIDYNVELDQILLSARNYQEVWIIDHSTTNEEADTSTGGNSNNGGDLIFRWGNPLAYKSGLVSDQKLIYQHDSKWINDTESEYHGQLLIFNNKIGDKISVGEIIKPAFDFVENSYLKDVNGTFLPVESTRQISHPDSLKNDSTHASSIQLLRNGNFLICAAIQGRIFELTNEEEPVWEYIVPLTFGEPTPQGETIFQSYNFTNQVIRYPLDFSGFIGKDLSPGAYLELNPNEDFCTLTSNSEIEIKLGEFEIVNSIVEDILVIYSSQDTQLQIINLDGNLVLEVNIVSGINEIDFSNHSPGNYFTRSISSKSLFKFIKL